MKIGIIGTGRIAERFVKTALVNQPDLEVACVYNPKIESAARFAEVNGVKQFTDSLKKFVEKVDAVYVASPHETHYEYSKSMLKAGKHVLSEKPLALSASNARELFALAEEKKLVLMEAIKTAHCPGFIELLKVAKSGVIGEIVDVEAAFTRLTDKSLREFTDAGFGGSFMEFGSYVTMPAIKFLGTDYKTVEFKSITESNGVDNYTKSYLDYSNKMATGKTGLSVKSEGQLLISGTAGYILAPSPWWLTKKFEVRFEDPNKCQLYEFEYVGSGLQYEVDAFVKKISGDVDKEWGMTSEESIAIAGVFEEFLKSRK